MMPEYRYQDEPVVFFFSMIQAPATGCIIGLIPATGTGNPLTIYVSLMAAKSSYTWGNFPAEGKRNSAILMMTIYPYPFDISKTGGIT